ncbi:MAG: hypothetical protein J6S96_01715 [Muribaculaceae bacterium]|nr:hypothetical protein [Muribaculaceae bacterium]
MDNTSIIDEYLKKPYWIIDILPKQVPASNGSQYFKVEKYFLSHPQIEDLCRKFTKVLIKLSCYEDMEIVFPTDDHSPNPIPDIVEQIVYERKPFYVVIKSADAMIGYEGDEHYMTLYNANEELLELVKLLAISEGLFLWQP